MISEPHQAPRRPLAPSRPWPIRAAHTLRVKAGLALPVVWPKRGRVGSNWGDKLNPWLVRQVSGKDVVHADMLLGQGRKGAIFAVGSGLHWALRDGGTVWGQGFMSADQGLGPSRAKIHAVRGRRSREKLESLGWTVPAALGDPALLMPRFYDPGIRGVRHAIGFIPHYRELDLPVTEAARRRDDVRVIDITGGLFRVIDQVTSCGFILSSSLHGLVIADAYGVPSRWIRLSGRPKGDGFKYLDHYSAIGRTVEGPVPLDETTPLERALEGGQDHRTDIDLDLLLEACPFRKH